MRFYPSCFYKEHDNLWKYVSRSSFGVLLEISKNNINIYYFVNIKMFLLDSFVVKIRCGNYHI